MTARPPRVDSRSHVVPRRPDGRRGRVGPYIGPVRITPALAVLAVGLVGSLAFIAYAVLQADDSAQIPMVTTGATVLGVVLTAISVGGAIEMWRAWREGRQGRTVLFAVVGGMAGMFALGSFAGALVLALVWGS